MKNRYHYTESGLANVWLVNGFTRRKTKYGDGVSIRNVDELHRALAQALAIKPRLTGNEQIIAEESSRGGWKAHLAA
jgi:hypothetical protein